jgi:hypothetical protein
MRWTEVATELGTQTFLAGLKAAKSRVSKRRYKRLIATTVAQVLALHPDLGAKKARRQAEKVTGAAPSRKLIKVKKGDGLREGARAVAATLVAGGALKAVKAAGDKLAGNGRSRKKTSASRPSPRASARGRRTPSGAPDGQSGVVDAGAEKTE